MQGPDDDFRDHVARRAEQADSEDELEGLLAEIEERVGLDAEGPVNQNAAEEELGAVDSWAAVASHTVARFHAPASPWPSNPSGWGQRIAARLRRIAGALRNVLEQLKTGLRAASYSIGVSFPWGISISIGW